MEVNWIAILVSAVFSMVLGAVWYSPALFGKQWMKLSGMTKGKIAKSKDKMPMIYGGQFLASLVEIWVLSVFIRYTGVEEFVTGAIVGLWIWLGFVATVGFSDIVFNGKDLRLVAINTGYQLVLLIVAGGILATWA